MEMLTTCKDFLSNMRKIQIMGFEWETFLRKKIEMTQIFVLTFGDHLK